MAAVPDVPDAAPFYSNLVNNTCTSCTYSTDNGFFILGPNNCFAPGSTQWISYSFVAGHTGNVKRVTLAITDSGFCAATSTGFTVQIYDNSNCNGTPSNPLGTPVNAMAPAAPCATAVANFGRTGPRLPRDRLTGW